MENFQNILNKVKKIHFIGIGGSGMCPMAEILRGKGYEITGSDIYISDTLENLIASGVVVSIGHNPKNIEGKDLIVYSAAIKMDNPEIVAAKKLEIPVVERSEMLGLITQMYKNSIAVSGTHGKTTTTAMITQTLMIADCDPTAIIGGRLPFIEGNSRVGTTDVIVCEACEYVDTFLHLRPYISVILNIDADHLDYFKNLENIKKSFNKFASQTSGALIVNGDDENTMSAIKGLDKEIVTFGFNKTNDYYAEIILGKEKGYQSFDLMYKGNKLTNIKLNVPGRHNIYNALAAAATSHYMGAKAEKIKLSLEQFNGVHRRFEILGKVNDIVVADDFAHHPTELRAVLTAAKDMDFKTVWAVFQPHTYSRTYMLLDDFAKALSIADRVVLSEILAVRETNTYNIYSKDLGEKIDGCVCLDTFPEITDFIEKNAKPGDLVLTIGGGNVYRCANMILDRLKKNNIKIK